MEGKQKLIEELKTYTFHYDKILVLSAEVKTIVGKTMLEIAEQAGISPEEALLDAVRANGGRVSIIGRTVSPKNTLRAIKAPYAIIASDGEGYAAAASEEGNLAHPRSFGAFPHFWHRFVKDVVLMEPQVAIRRVTSMPAEKVGIGKRGVLQKGYAADVIVFDPDDFRDQATYRNPFRYARGLETVIINGKVVAEKGKCLGVRAGEVLRKMVR